MKREVNKYRDWHLRCYICDHNFEMPESDYVNLEVPVESGTLSGGGRKITAGKDRKNTSWVGIDNQTGKPICNECWRSIYESVREMEWLDSLKE